MLEYSVKSRWKLLPDTLTFMIDWLINIISKLSSTGDGVTGISVKRIGFLGMYIMLSTCRKTTLHKYDIIDNVMYAQARRLGRGVQETQPYRASNLEVSQKILKPIMYIINSGNLKSGL